MASDAATISAENSSVHVTGFPANVAEDVVRGFFAAYGTVSSVKVLPQKADKPDAAAIITMEGADKGAWLVENVNGKVPPGMTAPLVVKMKISNNWSTGEREDPQDTVHVTGLPADVAEDVVRGIFAAYGTVTSVKVLPQKADKPDAAAIVTMESSDLAKSLVENANGKVPAGMSTPLVVKMKINNSSKGYGKGMPKWAYQQMMQYYGKGGGKGSSSWGGLSSFAAEKKVWIGGIPEEGVTYKELQEHFPGSKFAAVMKGKSAGTGGVAFATAEEASSALATLNGSVLAGATLVVDVWTKKEPEAPAAA